MICRSVALCAALVAFATASAIAAAEDSIADPVAREFRAFDTNHDGYISKREMRHYRDFDQAFEVADLNRDGKLDVQEFARARAAYRRIQTAQYIEDSVISAKVRAALQKELISQSVRVQTHRGHVLLSGTVRDAAQRVKAEQAAASVEGVVKVTDGLLLK